jgi:hypothetical protein
MPVSRCLLMDAQHVSMLGSLSLALSGKMKARELARVKAKRQRPGDEGLKKQPQKFKAARDGSSHF